MALRIVNNIAALNTQRWLSVADTGMKKSLERLSSGYRINKAADDAAGLAISQSFRADIASFNVASRNASEAGALLQVAEGAMDQIGNMLSRLKELATQAASANVGTTERVQIGSEADDLLEEINRIANSTKYGSTSLIDGSFGDLTSGALASSTGNTTAMVQYNSEYYSFANTSDQWDTKDFDSFTVTSANVEVLKTGTWTFAAAGVGTLDLTNGDTTVTGDMSAGGTTLTIADLGIEIVFSAAGVNTVDLNAETIQINDIGLATTNLISLGSSAATGAYTITDTAGAITLTDKDSNSQTITKADGVGTLNFTSLDVKLTFGAEYDGSDLNNIGFTATQSGETTFQIGAKDDTYNRITVSIGDTKTTNLGIIGSGTNALSSIDLTGQSTAQDALAIIDYAVSDLSGLRAGIGASMNRLTYASANLSTTIENVQAAESVIRDVDMAAEMTNFTKNQILLQAGTAMLAQANMAPQQVLALFG